MNPSLLARIAQAHRGASGGDPYWSAVASLLHFDGANGSTTFADEVSGMSWSPDGSAQLSTANKKFGTASGLFSNATSDGILCAANAALAFGTGDFTIEFFIYISSLATASAFDNRFGSYNSPLVMYNDSVTKTTWYIYNGGNVATFTLATGTWQHVAISRVSGTARVFLDGVQQGSWADTHSFNQQQFCIARRYVNANQSINGNIDEFRITNGVGRYTADFTPPAAAFPAY